VGEAGPLGGRVRLALGVVVERHEVEGDLPHRPDEFVRRLALVVSADDEAVVAPILCPRARR
jgi:hypothetical protein